ncbi:MAG: serine protease [Gammaproteobacteria bacterium]|nr:MAG: serine protease [Gammaproteobacteria bacterium]
MCFLWGRAGLVSVIFPPSSSLPSYSLVMRGGGTLYSANVYVRNFSRVFVGFLVGAGAVILSVPPNYRDLAKTVVGYVNGGTCFAYKRDEKGTYLLTAHHVVKDLKGPASVEFFRNSKSLGKAQAFVIAAAPEMDLAVLFTAKQLNFCLTLSKETIHPGDRVVRVGCDMSRPPVITEGLVARSTVLSGRWVVTAPLYGGGSGGPVIDVKTGKVIGVTQSIGYDVLRNAMVPHLHICLGVDKIVPWLRSKKLL